MIGKRLFLSTLCGLLVAPLGAAPILEVKHLGVQGTNREWAVNVAPDPSLFSVTPEGLGGSMAVELALEVTGSSIISVQRDGSWPFENPGNNPFASSVTEGISISGGNQQVFAALGSDIFKTGASRRVLTIVTGIGATNLSWGGHILLGGTPAQYVGSRIVQRGMNFDGQQGSKTSTLHPADLNLDGTVDAADAAMLFSDWGANRGIADITADGIVDAADAGTMFGGWTGDAVTGVTPVPEPMLGMLFACGLAVSWRGFRRHSRPQ